MISFYLITSAALLSSPLIFDFGDFVSSVCDSKGYSHTTTRSHNVRLVEKVFLAWVVYSKIRERKNNWKLSQSSDRKWKTLGDISRISQNEISGLE